MNFSKSSVLLFEMYSIYENTGRPDFKKSIFPEKDTNLDHSSMNDVHATEEKWERVLFGVLHERLT